MEGQTFFLMKALSSDFLVILTSSSECSFQSLQPLESSVLAGSGRFNCALVFDLDVRDGLRWETVANRGEEGSV